MNVPKCLETLPSGEVWEINEDSLIRNVHLRDECRGSICVLHYPTHHVMSEFPLHWRWDRAIFERICPHGIGHPDPDQFDYWQMEGKEYEAIHGCDGCC